MDQKQFRMKDHGFESYTSSAPYAMIPRELKDYMTSHFSKNDSGLALFLLSCSVAYKSGYANYANHNNFVVEGSWAGGKVGLRSILHNKKLQFEDIAELLTDLQNKGYLTYSVKNKFIQYQMNDFDEEKCGNVEYATYVSDYLKLKKSGKYVYTGVTVVRKDKKYVQVGFAKKGVGDDNSPRKYQYKNIVWEKANIFESSDINKHIYAMDNYGYIKFPKTLLNERARKLRERKGKRCLCARTKAESSPFSEGEAFLDLYVHSVRRDFKNAFSWFCPAVMLGSNVTLSYSDLAERWGWNKSKVQRFFTKHSDFFRCIKLNKNCGSIIFNISNPEATDKLPRIKTIQKILRKLVPMGKICKEFVSDFIIKGSLKYIKKYFLNTVYCPKGDANNKFRDDYFANETEKESRFFANTYFPMRDDRGFLVSEVQRALIFDDWLCKYIFCDTSVA